MSYGRYLSSDTLTGLRRLQYAPLSLSRATAGSAGERHPGLEDKVLAKLLDLFPPHRPKLSPLTDANYS